MLAPSYLGHAAPPRDQVVTLRGRVRETLEQVEQFLEPGPFLAGDQIMAPDFMFASEIFALDCDPEHEHYLADLPRLSSWRDHLRSLGSYGISHRPWNAVVPIVQQRLTDGVAPGSDPGWVADLCEQVLGDENTQMTMAANRF